jgi:hypothetical protein
MSSISSANAILTLSIAGLFGPTQIQQWASDEFYATDPIEATEVLMGIDGTLSGGFVWSAVPQTISLQANSTSRYFFETWWGAQKQIQDAYPANGLLILPGPNTKYTLVNGFMTTIDVMPSAGKILRPRKYRIMWNTVQAQGI